MLIASSHRTDYAVGAVRCGHDVVRFGYGCEAVYCIHTPHLLHTCYYYIVHEHCLLLYSIPTPYPLHTHSIPTPYLLHTHFTLSAGGLRCSRYAVEYYHLRTTYVLRRLEMLVRLTFLLDEERFSEAAAVCQVTGKQ